MLRVPLGCLFQSHLNLFFHSTHHLFSLFLQLPNSSSCLCKLIFKSCNLYFPAFLDPFKLLLHPLPFGLQFLPSHLCSLSQLQNFHAEQLDSLVIFFVLFCELGKLFVKSCLAVKKTANAQENFEMLRVPAELGLWVE
jgi:hypothetical protein